MLHCNTYTINFINKQTNSKFDEHLRNVRYLWFRSYGWEGNYNKKFEKVTRTVNVIFLRKVKKQISYFQIEVFSFPFFLCVSSVFLIFHSHFWLSLEQQSGRGNVSIRRQISIKLYHLNWSYLVTPYTCKIQDNVFFI